MTRDGKHVVRYATTAAVILALLGLPGIVREAAAVRNAGVAGRWEHLAFRQELVWWSGVVAITWFCLLVGCAALVAGSHANRAWVRTLIAGSVGGVVPIATVACSTLWVDSSYALSHPGEWLGCLLPARTLVVGPFIAGLLVPGVFLHKLLRHRAGA
jgi:hypothetical protein